MPTDQPDLIVERYLRRLGGGRPDPAALTFYASLDQMRSVDPLVADRVVAELVDQRANIKLIASENYASLAVQQAMGNLLTDKYAEGSAGHRFYAGCDNVDAIESHGAELAKALFGADHAYLQPHSGIDANLVAFIAILATRVEDRCPRAARREERLGAVATSSSPRCAPSCTTSACSAWTTTRAATSPTATGSTSRRGCSTPAGTPSTGRPACSTSTRCARQLHEVRPLILLAGYSAYTRKIDFAKMREIADEVGATFMVDMAHFAGLVAGKVFTGAYDPVPHAHVVTTHHAQDPAWPARRHRPVTDRVRRAVDKGCPAVLGGPLPHVMAAKAVALHGGARSRIPGVRRPDRGQRARARRRAAAARGAGGDRGHGQPPRAGRRRVDVRAHRPPGRVGAARGAG